MATTATVIQMVTKTISAASSASATSSARAANQGGIFQGRIPTHYEVKDPIALFIIQAAIVITMTRLLHWPLSKLRQPRVIAEVITGIILGPSIMGRIPNFTANIFPTASMPAFTLAANLGLVFFLFLVGLEVDLRFLVSNWRVAAGVGAAGMAIPFGLGVAVAWGLHREFHDEPNVVPISFGIYALFIGVAMAITAFPVLCRILTSLKLLSTSVGVIVLSAGVANDVVGWILLALCVTLVNASAGLVALWIFLVAVGYSLFVAFAVRPLLVWSLRKSGSLANGPSQTVVAAIVFMVLASAFFTDVIGIHAIFGAFMIGLICPHEGGFAIKLTEKIEDLISVLFLPLYFALSGLSTNLGLLDNGITWAYVVAITAVAFFGKIGGATLASRLSGLVWRESATIGVLMSCKGLVELIVLNIGLQARILSTRTFTMFVVMALITTFATTPLTTWLYPPWYQEKLDLWKRGKIDWDGQPIAPIGDNHDSEDDDPTQNVTNKMLIYLRLDALPGLHNVMNLLLSGQGRNRKSITSLDSSDETRQEDKSKVAETTVAVASENSYQASDRPLRIHGMRMMELTERNSSVMKVAELEDYAAHDPVIKAFGMSAAQQASGNVTISGQVSIVPDYSFSTTLVSRAKEISSDFILVPWSETGSISENPPIFDVRPNTDPLSNRQFANLASEVFDKAVDVAHVGVFVDKSLLTQPKRSRDRSSSFNQSNDRPIRTLTRTTTGLSFHDTSDETIIFHSTNSHSRRQICALYYGTRDDLLAVKLALQFARNEDIDVQVIKITPSSDHITNNSKYQDPDQNTLSHTQIDAELENLQTNIPNSIRQRVQFHDLDSTNSDSIAALLYLSNQPKPSKDVILMLGRSNNTQPTSTSAPTLIRHPSSSAGATPATTGTTSQLSQAEQSRPLGHRAAGLLSQIRNAGNGKVSLLVVQAKSTASTAHGMDVQRDGVNGGGDASIAKGDTSPKFPDVTVKKAGDDGRVSVTDSEVL